MHEHVYCSNQAYMIIIIYIFDTNFFFKKKINLFCDKIDSSKLQIIQFICSYIYYFIKNYHFYMIINAVISN